MRLSRKMTAEMTEQESSRQTPAGTMESTVRQPRGKRLINRQLVCLGNSNACVWLRFGIINSIIYQPAAKVANINYNNNDNQGCARFASTKHIPPCGTWVLFNPRSLLPFEKFIARQRNHWTKWNKYLSFRLLLPIPFPPSRWTGSILRTNTVDNWGMVQACSTRRRALNIQRVLGERERECVC